MFAKRITIFAGHFGSGKSELAVNFALAGRARNLDVTLCDLDVVKPYFRSRLVKADLKKAGVHFVAPEGEQFYADLPMVIPAVRGAIQHAQAGHTHTILDVGGDDSGARVLGSLSDVLRPEHAEVLFVVNINRPFADTAAALLAMVREIEGASRLKVSGLVANTHLMDETTVDTVREGLTATRALSKETGIPVSYCAALAAVCEQLQTIETQIPLIPIERFILPPHVARRPGSQRSMVV